MEKNKKNLLEEEQSGIIAETLMNISEKGEKLIHSTNVYNSCNGDYRRGQRINREYIAASKDHELIKTKRGVKVVIDKNANDLDQVFISEGRVIPPDEILDSMKPDSLKIPMKLRGDFKGDSSMLPDSDLLKAIHYFVSKKYDKVLDRKGQRRMIQSLDETALMAMGLLLESWCDEIITNEVAKMFTKKYPKEDPPLIQSDDDLVEEEIVGEEEIVVSNGDDSENNDDNDE